MKLCYLHMSALIVLITMLLDGNDKFRIVTLNPLPCVMCVSAAFVTELKQPLVIMIDFLKYRGHNKKRKTRSL